MSRADHLFLAVLVGAFIVLCAAYFMAGGPDE